MTTKKRTAIAPDVDVGQGQRSLAASGWARHHHGLPTPTTAPQLDFIAQPALALAGPLALDDLAYLDRLYNAEMQAGEKAPSTDAKVAHYGLAYRCALRARELRASMRL